MTVAGRTRRPFVPVHVRGEASLQTACRQVKDPETRGSADNSPLPPEKKYPLTALTALTVLLM